MALTRDNILEQSALKGLTDDQIGAIVSLSQNDERSVVERAVKDNTAEHWNRLDQDIKEVFGQEKDRTVKSWEMLKQVLTEAKNSAAGSQELKDQVTSLTEERDRLKADLEKGGGDQVVADLRKQLNDKESELKKVRDQLGEVENDYQKKLTEKDDALDRFKFEQEIYGGLNGIEYNENIPKTIREREVRFVVEDVMNKYKRDWINDGENKVPVFRDQDGNIVTDPKNLNKPMSPFELVKKNLTDLIKVDGGNGGKGQGGGGTEPPAGGGQSSIVLDRQPKTQREATELIHEALMRAGIAADSPEYSKKMREEYEGMNVSDLPLR
jgi:hypothetical protein